LDLTSPGPLWPLQNGLIATYPALEGEEQADSLVLGAGITGALLADELSRSGQNVVVLDRREVAHGSTCASTGLLQYEIDTLLQDLIPRHGEAHAVRAYRLCWEAIDRLELLVRAFDDDCGFRRKPSCYLASRTKHVRVLQAECALRQRYGFPVNFLTAAEIAEGFSFAAPGAIWSNQGGEIDAFRLTHQLLARAQRQGARIYDRTEAVTFQHEGAGWRITTQRGSQVTAKSLVIATGYEAPSLMKRNPVSLHSTFAVASQPLREFPGWPEECLLWETARPYFYARTTCDGRVVIGGEDVKFRNATARDALIPRKTQRLEKRFRELFPDIPFETEFAWAGTFGETHDGLAYIGSVEELPDAWFALGYGGNGVTYSVIAANLLRDFLLGRENPDAAIFGFDRR
jgi:glycine/D-amino acid oxidase-like deaminating enzyme